MVNFSTTYCVIPLLAACLTLAAGCSDEAVRPPAAIAGIVTLGDEPLKSGSIQFTSPDTGESAYSNLDENGRYRVEFPAADVGALYEVTVGPAVEEDVDATAVAENPQPRTESQVPQKYRQRTTSGLSFRLASEGENTYDVALER